MSGLASSSPASRSTTARAAASSAASTVSSTRRPTRTALTPLDAEVAEAALDRPTLRIEDAGLGRDVDGEPVACSSGDDVLREIAIEAGAGDPLEGRDVALARAARRRRRAGPARVRVLSHGWRSSQSRTNCLSKLAWGRPGW